MEHAGSGSGKTRLITLDIDVNAKLEGFDSANAPTRAHRDIMKNFCSVLLLGPPAGDAMLAVVTHMFTDEEADVARHLRPLLPLTARQVAFFAGRPADEVEPLLENLAENKRVVLSFGRPRRYTILPLVPGTFEMAIMAPDLSRANSWHKRFAELFEEVWDSEYMKDYVVPMPPAVRYLPSQGNSSRLQSAWPTDRLEEILDPYETFGVAHCQCRVVTQLAGRGCGKPTENCIGIGPMAEPLIARGRLRRAEKKEVIELKREAEEHACITWMMNGRNDKSGNYSCSCCGCCCHALRSITQLNMPGLFSPPHFIPKRNNAACTQCGRCVRVCPMGAWTKVGVAVYYDQARCLGCGLCVTACKENALELVEALAVKQPETDMAAMLLKALPVYVSNSFRVWLRRATGIG